MSEASRSMSLEELIECEKRLVDSFKEDNDIVNFKHFLRQSGALLTQCEKDFNQTQKSIEEYERKIDSCEWKVSSLEPESDCDKELELLERELENEKQLEKTLREELRYTMDEIDVLKRQMESVEEQNRTVRKFEKQELKLENKLSMHASVTKVIPNMEDTSIVSGYIVDRQKKDANKFDVDPQKMSSFDSCDYIWKLINSS